MPPRPPHLASRLIAWLTPEGDVDVILGDLAEEFEKRVARDGPTPARRWYWQQACRSLVPTLKRRYLPDPLEIPEKGTTMRTFGDGLMQDVRFSLRMALRRPLVSAVSVASLTVGIALTATVFTLINAALIRPMAVAAPGELAWITEQRPTNVNITLPWPDFVDMRRDQRVFTDMAASASAEFNLRLGDRQLTRHGEFVSDAYFPLLDPELVAGRYLTSSDHEPGSPVVVVSSRLWRELAGDAEFLPTAVSLNERSLTIVGVVDSAFSGVWSGRLADLWIPVKQFHAISGGPDRFTERRMSWLVWIARRKTGVTFDAAAADLNRIEAVLAPAVGRPQPKQFRVTDGSRGATAGTDHLEPTLRLLLAAALVVLLVACANVANLLLARGAERRRELAIRTALGASRLRVLRLLVVEAGVIALLSTVAAAGISVLGARLSAPLITAFGSPIALNLSPDWRLVALLAAAGLATTLLSGLAPAVGALPALATSLDSSSRSATSGRRATRVRQGLLVLQFGASVALVVAAILLFRTVANLRSQPTGFDTDRVALLTVSLRGAGFDPDQGTAYLSNMARRLMETPGVEAVGFARTAPVGFGGSRSSLSIPGVTPEGEETEEINFNQVSAGYLEAMGIGLVAGRTFTATDDTTAPAIIVNETMARQFWPEGAVGRTIRWDPDRPPVPIVGVVRDAKYRMVREAPMPSFYIPMSMGRPGDGTFHVRVAAAPDARLDDLRGVMTALYPAVPVTAARTLRSQTERNLSDDRLALSIGLSLAGAALILAAAGLFGSMLYFVTQRTREIGVRVALGADTRSVHTLVLSQGLRLALAGSAIGLVGAVWTSRAIETRLFGVTAEDPVSFIAAALVLTAVALVATWLPARRAARVDPIHALRDE